MLHHLVDRLQLSARVLQSARMRRGKKETIFIFAFFLFWFSPVRCLP